MNLIIKIAWRNIMRHRGKSLIIGAILFIGALLMTVGNGVISGMNAGLQKNIVEGFCGDAVIVAQKQESDNVFLEFMGKSVEPINNFKAIDSALTSFSALDRWLPIGKNFAIALNDEGVMADGVFVLGVDFKEYQRFFGTNLKVIEGALPQNNEPFVLVPTGWRKQFAEYYNFIFTPEGSQPDTATLGTEVMQNYSSMTFKHDIVYMGMSTENTTTDVRVPIKAIVKYRSLNTIWGQFPIMDIESYRVCLGYFSAQAKSADVDKETLDLLATNEESLDDLFSDASLMSNESVSSSAPSMMAEGSLIVEKDTLPQNMDLEAGTFNIILVRFKDSFNNSRELDAAVKKLDSYLSSAGLGVRAIPWHKATGMIGSMAVLIKLILVLFVACLFFVAIIIIMNTLSMAAIERVPEIGMMRAVGAQKPFIQSMFFGETAVLSAVFGGAGIVVGVVIVKILAMLHLSSTNDMVQILYGGDNFQPLLTIPDLGIAIGLLGLVTIAAVIYPLVVASKITPLDAVSRE